MSQHDLPVDYLEDYQRIIKPLAEAIETLTGDTPPVIGIAGSQGSGKSTLCDFLALLLEPCAIVSLDDYYLGREQRQNLARDRHPLLATRGVPGTHDTLAGIAAIQSLRNGPWQPPIPMRRFSKADDDLLPREQWGAFCEKPRAILFEGWCVGCPLLPEIDPPMNALEANEDPDGSWRREIQRALEEEYSSWFDELDALVFLRAPSFEKVFEWRAHQEAQLRKLQPDGMRLMDDVQLRRFLDHYERLTRHMLQLLPQMADATIPLGDDHRMRSLEFSPTGAFA